MGKGQRHSKNAGVMGSESLTYHERKALGFGTMKERLGKDSMGNYYDCCLTLQPAVDPVVTPHGYLYSKEAILENLLQQKKAIKRKLAAWEAEQEANKQKAAEKAAVEQQAELLAFDRANHSGISLQTVNSLKQAIEDEAEHLHDVGRASSVIAIKDNADRARELKAFWLPSKTPEAPVTAEKPDSDTHCPASGNKLKLKDLIPVKFTPVEEGGSGRYMDPLTKDTFTNATKLVILKPTGDVVSKETYEKLIKLEGRFNGVNIKVKDVIELQTGGTGYAARDKEKVQAQKTYVLGPGSGRQDWRGQHAGPRSLGGLQFWN